MTSIGFLLSSALTSKYSSLRINFLISLLPLTSLLLNFNLQHSRLVCPFSFFHLVRGSSSSHTNDRAFSVIETKLRNKLPPNICSFTSASASSFKCSLKSHLYSIVFLSGKNPYFSLVLSLFLFALRSRFFLVPCDKQALWEGLRLGIR